MTEQKLVISFNYHLEEYNKPIFLEAIAESAASKSCFRIHSFRVCTNKPANRQVSDTCILPPIEISYIEKEGKKTWIHNDSEKESHLSIIIGKAIEETQYIHLRKTT
jgi:hypothetical protein